MKDTAMDQMEGPSATEQEHSRAAANHFTDDYLAYLLARASHLVSAQFHAQLAAAGVSVPVWRILASLSDRASLTIGELAEIVILKQPTLSKILDRMIEEKLVARIPADDDRRRVNVSITLTGRERVADLLRRAKEDEAEALAGYAESEIEHLKSMLRGMITRLAVAGA